MNQMSYTKGSLLPLSVVLLAVLAAAVPTPVSAQDVVVQGRVFEFGSTSVIPNARVELEGYGATLTSVVGTFRFEDVEPGEYALRVDAFGYASESRVLVVDSTTRLVLVPLRIAPLTIDTLTVELQTIDIKGRVRDPAHDLLLVNAEVLTNQVEGTQTDAHGRFTLDNVLEGVPLRVIVRPYGYLRVDTILLPDEDESYVFEVEPDPWVEEMIAEQVGRIEERSAGRARIVPSMNREDVLRYAGTFTLYDMLETEYRYYMPRVVCALIDEEHILNSALLGHMLETIYPQEVELIEFLFFDRALMLRIYTRKFMQEMFDLNIQLRVPALFGAGNPPVCL